MDIKVSNVSDWYSRFIDTWLRRLRTNWRTDSDSDLFDSSSYFRFSIVVAVAVDVVLVVVAPAVVFDETWFLSFYPSSSTRCFCYLLLVDVLQLFRCGADIAKPAIPEFRKRWEGRAFRWNHFFSSATQLILSWLYVRQGSPVTDVAFDFITEIYLCLRPLFPYLRENIKPPQWIRK